MEKDLTCVLKLLMKTVHLLIFLLSFGYLAGQDTLVFKDKRKLAVILMEVNPDNIKYKRFDNKDGATYKELKSNLQYVKLNNGEIERFNEVQISTEEVVQKDGPKNERDSVIYKSNEETDPFFAGDKPDILLFKSGKKTEAKVLIINETEVKYKLWSFQDGPTYHATKSELSSVAYANGKSENFNDSQNENVAVQKQEQPTEEKNEDEPEKQNNNKTETPIYTSPTLAGETSASLYAKGQKDARLYYKGYGGAVGSGCSAVGCTPLIGWVPTVFIATNEPNHLKLNMPYSIYSAQPEYIRGYKETAYKIKKKRAWGGYGIGSAAFILLYAISLATR